MAGDDIVRAFLQHSDATGAKSTVLKPLGWLIGILLSGAIGLRLGNAPAWIAVVLVVFVGISVFLYLGAYIYFARKDPDLLRSESFALRKLEIEKGIIGDSLTGIIETKPSRTLLKSRGIKPLPSGEDQK